VKKIDFFNVYNYGEMLSAMHLSLITKVSNSINNIRLKLSDIRNNCKNKCKEKSFKIEVTRYDNIDCRDNSGGSFGLSDGLSIIADNMETSSDDI
jgi:hypothetical protein